MAQVTVTVDAGVTVEVLDRAQAQAEVTALKAQVTSLQGQLAALQAKVTAAKAALA